MNRDWELTEKLAISRRLKNPEVAQALRQLGFDPDSLYVQVAQQLAFRGDVLDELERFEPERVKEATAAVLGRSK